MGPVDQAVHDRVGDRGLPQVVMPLLARQLAGDDRRPSPVAIVDHFQQIAAMPIGDRRQAPVVQDQDIDAGEARQDGDIGAIGMREGAGRMKYVWAARAMRDARLELLVGVGLLGTMTAGSRLPRADEIRAAIQAVRMEDLKVVSDAERKCLNERPVGTGGKG